MIPNSMLDLLNSAPGIQNQVFSNYGFNPHGSDELITALQKYGQGLYPGAVQQGAFGLSMLPQYQNAISGLVNSLSPAGLTSQMNQNIAGTQQQYANSGQEAALQAAGAGLGGGIQAGLINANQGQANSAINQIRDYYTSPATKAQAFGSMMNAFQQGFSNPFAQQMMQITQPLAQQQQINYAQQSPGFLSQAGGLLGNLLGSGGLSHLFGMGAPQQGGQQWGQFAQGFPYGQLGSF